MTFIKPKKYNNSFLNFQIIILALMILASSFSLIVLYNRTVALRHEASLMNESTKEHEARKAELTEEMIALFESDKAKDFALNEGLVVDDSPTYIEIFDKWVFASHF